MDSSSRLVTDNWLEELERRAKTFQSSPSSFLPHVTPEGPPPSPSPTILFTLFICFPLPDLTSAVFESEDYFSKEGFYHPVLVYGRLPYVSLPSSSFANSSSDSKEEFTIEIFRDLIGIVFLCYPSCLSPSHLVTGPEEPVHVIDVSTQNLTTDRWTIGKWAKYFRMPASKRKSASSTLLDNVSLLIIRKSQYHLVGIFSHSPKKIHLCPWFWSLSFPSSSIFFSLTLCS